MIPALIEFLYELTGWLFLILYVEQRAAGTPVNIIANFIG
jgi:hypothetical protein